MAAKTKVREITLVEEKGTFSSLFRRLYGETDDYDFKSLAALRNVLSNQKARIIHIIKTRSPTSIYQLAHFAGRDFKAVNNDVKLLERFGFIDLVKEKSGKRIRLKPVMAVDTIKIEIKL